MGNGRKSGLAVGVKNTTERVPGNSQVNYEKFRSMGIDDAAQYYSNTFSDISDEDLTNLGLNTNGLSRLAYQLQATRDAGITLTDADFDAQIKSAAFDGLALYRGSTQAAINNLMNGEHGYLGNGIHGDGIYFSTDPHTANTYGGSRVTAYLDKGLAKVVSEDRLYDMLGNESPDVRHAFRGDSGFSAYAIYKGYNVIRADGGNNGYGWSIAARGSSGEDYFVPLTREVLVFREHYKGTKYN